MPAWVSKTATSILIGAGLLLIAAIVLLMAVNGASDWLETYRSRVIAGNDNRWKAQIAEKNLETARTQAAQLQQALQAEQAAQTKMREAETLLAELEKQNADLPNGDRCALDRDRVRLLAR